MHSTAVTFLSLCLLLIGCGQSEAVGGYSSYRSRQWGKWGAAPPPSRSLVLAKEEQRPDIDMNSLFPDAALDYSEMACSGKKCTANEHCCSGAVCVDTDGLGTCLKVYGIKQGEPCERTGDCESGLVCLDNNENDVIFRTCQRDTSTYHKKPFNEDCSTSNECIVEKGLCCQIQRKHRQAPRKACLYFKDERACIGPVDNAEIGIIAANYKKSIPKSVLG